MDLISVTLWLQHHSVVAVGAVFVLIVLTTYWPGRRASIERHAEIPLQDDR